MLSTLRQKMRPLLGAVGGFLAFLPLNPMQFTFLAVPLSMAAGYLIATNALLPGAGLALAAVLIDVLDGSFAAQKGQASNFGNYWDAMVDKIMEVFLYGGLAFLYPLLAFFCFSTVMLVSHAKARSGLVIITDNHDWPTLGDRADRMTFLIIGLFAAAASKAHAAVLLQITLITVTAISSAGLVQRIFYARKLIADAEEEGTILPYLRR